MLQVLVSRPKEIVLQQVCAAFSYIIVPEKHYLLTSDDDFKHVQVLINHLKDTTLQVVAVWLKERALPRLFEVMLR